MPFNLETYSDSECWTEQAQIIMLRLAEKHMEPTAVFDRFVYERYMETLDRLHGLIREHHRRLKIMLPPGG